LSNDADNIPCDWSKDGRVGRFSPDQRWIAYASDESGRVEVYVRGFNPPGGKWRVSSDDGDSPVWRADARER
jgi:eukaryotic-like serine/threonine-protein kinase